MIKYFKLTGLKTLDKEFEFNFGPGSYLFCGPNGAGKTTVLDSLHPFDTSISRGVSIRDMLNPGGMKEIVITRHEDEFLIRITKMKGSSDTFFIQKNGKKHLLTQKVSAFRDEVNRLFLPNVFQFLQIHADSPDLSRVKNVEFKQQLLELAGGDQFEVIRGEIKKRLSSSKFHITAKEGELAGIRIGQDELHITGSPDEVKDSLVKAKAKKKKLETLVSEMEVVRQEYTNLTSRRNLLIHQLQVAETEVNRIEDILPKLDMYRRDLMPLDEKRERLSSILEELSEIQTIEFNELSALQRDTNTLEEQMRELSRKLSVSEKFKDIPCGKDLQSTCPLVPEIENVRDLKDQMVLVKIEKGEKMTLTEATKAKNIDRKKILVLEKTTLVKEVAHLTSLHDEVIRYEDCENRLEGLLSQIEVLTKQIKEIDENLTTCLYDAGKMAEIREMVHGIIRKISDCENQLMLLERMGSTTERKETLETELTTLHSTYDAQVILNKAFSVNEFPVLTLNSVVGRMNVGANSLFQVFVPELSLNAYVKDDARQTIEPDVYKNGQSVLMFLLSTGEKVWCNRITKIALALIANQQHPFMDVLTCDEGDGALHVSVREDFLKAHRTILESSGLSQLFLVSHDPRAEKVFDNVIRF